MRLNYLLVLLLLLLMNSLGLFAIGEKAHNRTVDDSNVLNFDILIGDSKIGDFTIDRIFNENTVEYFAHSNTEVQIFKHFSFTYTLHCVYKDSMLIKSAFVFKRNGTTTDSTFVDWDGAGYVVKKNGSQSYVNQKIYASCVELYFESPKAINQIFSEKEGEFMLFEKQETHWFQLNASNFSRSIDYYYQNQHLNEIAVDLSITEFRMVKQQIPLN